MISLPLLGAVGGNRVRLGADIIHYLIAAVGVGWVLAPRLSSTPNDQPQRAPSLRLMIGVPAAAAAIFLLAPWVIRSLAQPQQLIQPTPTHIAALHDAYPGIVSPEELDWIADLGYRGGDPLVAEITGKLTYRRWRFHPRDALELAAGEGISVDLRQPQLWPLATRDFARTILFEGPKFLILPGVTPEQLARFSRS